MSNHPPAFLQVEKMALPPFSGVWLILLCAFFLHACNGFRVDKVLKKRTPYESYLDALEDSPLQNSSMVRAWREAGEINGDSLQVDLPHSEHFYFDPQRPSAVFVHFFAREGEEILVSGEALPPNLPYFMDVFAWEGDSYKRLVSTDSTQRVSYAVKQPGKQVLRIQPELLVGGVVQIKVETRGLLAFPIPDKTSANIGSFWGDPRDGGGRRHEGVDVFAPRGTPVLAASDGRVRRVGTNRLGGKVVWLYDPDLNHSQYYAHLDSQAVRLGQRIAQGDTLGFVGNTGNAITTPPHLHFGIYRSGRGAVDPLPFLSPFNPAPDRPVEDAETLEAHALVSVDKANLRASPNLQGDRLASLERHTPLKVLGKSGDWLRVVLPDRSEGFIFGGLLDMHPEPLDEVVLGAEDGIQLEWDWPYRVSGELVQGTARVLGEYQGRVFISTYTGIQGWLVN